MHQVREFSTFLCMGKCKSLGSLKSFLGSAGYFSYPEFPQDSPAHRSLWLQLLMTVTSFVSRYGRKQSISHWLPVLFRRSILAAFKCRLKFFWKAVVGFLLFFKCFVFSSILLKYSWFTMWCLFLLYSKAIVMHIYTHTRFHSGLSPNVGCSSLCDTAGPRCSSILCVTICTCQSRTPSALLPLAPWQPHVCSLCLSVYFCFVGRLMCVIFQIPCISDNIRDHFLFLTYFTKCDHLQLNSH